jgi:hypothetical protein
MYIKKRGRKTKIQKEKNKLYLKPAALGGEGLLELSRRYAAFEKQTRLSGSDSLTPGPEVGNRIM